LRGGQNRDGIVGPIVDNAKDAVRPILESGEKAAVDNAGSKNGGSDKAGSKNGGSDNAVSKNGSRNGAGNGALNGENSALNGENSALNGDNSALNGENSALDSENSALNGENSAQTENSAQNRCCRWGWTPTLTLAPPLDSDVESPGIPLNHTVFR
jgi:hypothetical protein